MAKIDEVLEGLNGGVLGFRAQDNEVLFRALPYTIEPSVGWVPDEGNEVDFIISTRKWRGLFQEVSPIQDPPVFLQTDARWASKRYSPHSDLTFAQAGCLVCAAASLVVWAGNVTDPVSFAQVIADEGAFKGGELGHPSAVARAYPRLVWHHAGDRVFYSPRYDEKETSKIDWEERPADAACLAAILKCHPVPIKVDYKPKTRPVEQHFVLAYRYVPDPEGGLNDDLLVMDPMSGKTSALAYFNPDWLGPWMEQNQVSKVERLLMGARVWEVSDEI